MCTAITYCGSDHYFGRNLDLEYHYDEATVITPRKYMFPFEKKPGYSLVGIATVADGYPLYYDAMNEMGLGVAGLNFPDNAWYFPGKPGKNAVAPHDFIPWVLRRFSSVNEAVEGIQKIKIVDVPFGNFPQSTLHWILCDKDRAVTVEQTKSGMHLYQNPVGVLSNNPAFPYHMTNLANYMHLQTSQPGNTLCPDVPLPYYSRGMGAMGLPGDLSSGSRFIRAVFTRQNAQRYENEVQAVGQCFHILGAVKQTAGCISHNGHLEKTVYTSCCNLDKGIYYYTTYENSQITGVHLYHEDLDGSNLISYPLCFGQQIRMEN